jgi:hypothetical protein
MELKLIARMGNVLVYEAGKGKYINVYAREDGEGWCRVNSFWWSQLGMFAFEYTKCSSDPREDKCIKLMKENKEQISKELQELDEVYKEHPEAAEEAAKSSDIILSEAKDGETVEWYYQ